MLTSSSVHAVERFPATILSSVHPIPIRSLALHAPSTTLELHFALDHHYIITFLDEQQANN
jgi:hypothetical protein